MHLLYASPSLPKAQQKIYAHTMSVDFSAPHPTHTPSVSKPMDVQTLQETFAAALRRYGTERGSTPTNTLLEVLRPAQDSAGEDRNQIRRETQQHAARNDFTQIDRNLLNKSEMRSNEMNTDYRHRLDRQETLRNDYQERVERNIQQPAHSPAPPSTPPVDVTRPSEALPNQPQSLPQAQQIPPIASTNVPSPTIPNATPSAVQTSILQANILSVPTASQVVQAVPPPAAPPQAFTIFTPTSRFGQSQKKSEDEEEKEEQVEEKSAKKPQPFAALEAIRAETSRPVRQNPSRQSNELASQPPLQQVAERFREKPKEVDKARSVKTLDDLLNTSNISVKKKGEQNQQEQTRYLHRIAAACEAAARYAPIRIKINLDHLGTMTLRFYHKSDKLALRFETPTRESALFLRNNLDGLQSLLAGRNVKIMDIEIVWEE